MGLPKLTTPNLENKILLLQLVQNAHCSIKDSCIVKCYYTTIRALLEVNTYRTFSVKMLSAKIVTNGLNIKTQLVCNTL